MKRLRDLFQPVDRLKYLLWKIAGRQKVLEVDLLDGRRLVMRPAPTTDLETGYEILLADAYRRPVEVPDPRPVQYLVDVGANIGYSIMLWSAAYPETKILAFEPHPAHLAMLFRHIVANSLGDRVRVVAAAATALDGMAYIRDNENESAVVAKPGPGCMPIRLCDFFRELEIQGTRTIDLLKIDIEGGEYDLLDDPRFAQIDIRTIVLEWHNTVERPDGRRWCRDRLETLGFAVAEGAMNYGRAGILWAWQPASDVGNEMHADQSGGSPSR